MRYFKKTFLKKENSLNENDHKINCRTKYEIEMMEKLKDSINKIQTPKKNRITSNIFDYKKPINQLIMIIFIMSVNYS